MYNGTECQTPHQKPHPSGYVLVRRKHVKGSAHRLAWELVHGPVPKGKVVRHLCRNKACCNVEHLALGTLSENMLDEPPEVRSSRSTQANYSRPRELPRYISLYRGRYRIKIGRKWIDSFKTLEEARKHLDTILPT